MANITIDNDTLALVQRGYYKKPTFYGDMSMSSNGFDSFQEGVTTASNYISFASSVVNALVDQRRDTDQGFYLTNSEYKEAQKQASSISSYGGVPYQTVLDFLVILCSIDKAEDMLKISTVLEIQELTASVLRKPMDILAIPTLYKIAFMANALDSLIKLFSKYGNVSRSSSGGLDDIASLVSNLSSILGGASSLASKLNNGGAADAVGHFMTELIEGKRIPMPVIAKNPMKAAPSYVGQTLFGESPTSLSLVDIKEIHPKKIGVFPKVSNGSGVSSFGMMNFSSLAGNMNISSFVNNFVNGGQVPDVGSAIADVATSTIDKLKTMTGVTDTETFSLQSADVAIPLQIAMGAINCDANNSPFSTQSFQNGWQLSNHISNFMQNNNPNFLKIIKGFA